MFSLRYRFAIEKLKPIYKSRRLREKAYVQRTSPSIGFVTLYHVHCFNVYTHMDYELILRCQYNQYIVNSREKDCEPGNSNLNNRQSSDPNYQYRSCLLYTSPSPRDGLLSRMPSSAWKKKVCRLLLEKKKFIFFFFFFNDPATTEIYTLHIVGSVRCV